MLSKINTQVNLRGRLRLAVGSTAKHFVPRWVGHFCVEHPAHRHGVARPSVHAQPPGGDRTVVAPFAQGQPNSFGGPERAKNSSCARPARKVQRSAQVICCWRVLLLGHSTEPIAPTFNHTGLLTDGLHRFRNCRAKSMPKGWLSGACHGLMTVHG